MNPRYTPSPRPFDGTQPTLRPAVAHVGDTHAARVALDVLRELSPRERAFVLDALTAKPASAPVAPVLASPSRSPSAHVNVDGRAGSARCQSCGASRFGAIAQLHAFKRDHVCSPRPTRTGLTAAETAAALDENERRERSTRLQGGR